MISIISTLSILTISSVLAINELIIDKHLLDNRSAAIPIINHGAYIAGHAYDAAITRWVHLIPTVTADLPRKIACPGRGIRKIIDAINIDATEKITELLAISNCKSWYAIYLELYDAAAGSAIHKLYAIAKGADGIYRSPIIGGAVALADFIKDRVASDHMIGIIKEGIPAHAIIHHAITKYPYDILARAAI